MVRCPPRFVAESTQGRRIATPNQEAAMADLKTSLHDLASTPIAPPSVKAPPVSRLRRPAPAARDDDDALKLLPGDISWITLDECAACARFPHFKKVALQNLPVSHDWRELGAVTSVKNQGTCGSCWSFSAVADVEGTHFLATGVLEDFSEQQLVSCDTQDFGCQGGWPLNALRYIKQSGGVVSESKLPYDAAALLNSSDTNRRDTCEDYWRMYLAEKNQEVVDDLPADSGAMGNGKVNQIKLVSLGEDPEKDEDLMALALVRNGPLSLAMNAQGAQQ